MSSKRVRSLVGKTIERVDTKCANQWTFYFTDMTKATVDVEAKGSGIYGPYLESVKENHLDEAAKFVAKNRHLDQEAAMKVYGVSRWTWARWMAGTQKPSRQFLLRHTK